MSELVCCGRNVFFLSLFSNNYYYSIDLPFLCITGLLFIVAVGARA